MKKLFYFLFCSFILLSCSEESKKASAENRNVSKITDTTYVNGILLQIIDSNGGTNLVVNSNKYKKIGELKTATPSHFLKRNNKILSFSYPDVGIENTIVIQGKFGIQGVLFKKDSIIFGKYITTVSPFNIKEGADEKVYWDFAHKP